MPPDALGIRSPPPASASPAVNVHLITERGSLAGHPD